MWPLAVEAFPAESSSGQGLLCAVARDSGTCSGAVLGVLSLLSWSLSIFLISSDSGIEILCLVQPSGTDRVQAFRLDGKDTPGTCDRMLRPAGLRPSSESLLLGGTLWAGPWGSQAWGESDSQE